MEELPKWKQKFMMLRHQWRVNRNRRQNAYDSLGKTGAKALSLVLSLGGAILIAYGVYQVFHPAGYVTGGILCWVLQWSSEKDRRSG